MSAARIIAALTASIGSLEELHAQLKEGDVPEERTTAAVADMTKWMGRAKTRLAQEKSQEKKSS